MYLNILKNCAYPGKLKLADVSPVSKKENHLLAKNYRTINVLPAFTKVFKRLMQIQLNEHISQFQSPFLCGYKTEFSTKLPKLLLIERRKNMLHNKKYVNIILKASDTISYEILTAKLHTYGFSKDSLKSVLCCLKNRKERVKVNITVVSWVDYFYGTAQGSVLGQVLFKIFSNDFFFIIIK